MSEGTSIEEPVGAADEGDQHGDDEHGDDTEPGGRPSPSRTAFRVAVVAAVAFALLAVLLAVVAADLQSDLDAERETTAAQIAERDAVARTAGAFSEALLTYRFDDLEAARERVLALSTGSFASEYEAAFTGLSELIGEAQSEARATVKDVFVGDVGGGRAEAITVVDADVEGTSGSRGIHDAYIRLVLVRVDGEWLVDGVTSLNFTPAASAGTPTPGGGGG